MPQSLTLKGFKAAGRQSTGMGRVLRGVEETHNELLMESRYDHVDGVIVRHMHTMKVGGHRRKRSIPALDHATKERRVLHDRAHMVHDARLFVGVHELQHGCTVQGRTNLSVGSRIDVYEGERGLWIMTAPADGPVAPRPLDLLLGQVREHRSVHGGLLHLADRDREGARWHTDGHRGLRQCLGPTVAGGGAWWTLRREAEVSVILLRGDGAAWPATPRVGDADSHTPCHADTGACGRVARTSAASAPQSVG